MSLDLVLSVFGAALAVSGALFSLVAAIGILRFPDVFTRLHAASKAGVVGAGLILAAVAFVSLDGITVLRALLGIVFLLLSTPVGAHLIAKAANAATPGRPTRADGHPTADRPLPPER